MSIPGSTNPLLLFGDPTGGQYQISRSLRFNSSDSGFCSRVVSTAGDRKKWTWSGWAKRSKLGVIGGLFGSVISSGLGGSWAEFVFNSVDGLGFQSFASGGYNWYWRTNAVFRDTSAWYHVMIVCDQTETSVSNAIKFYVNGVLATHAETPSTWVTNQSLQINAANTHNIGKFDWTAEYLSGYLADIYFIDGQALDPSSFVETSATTGQLIPKAYSGSFGTNGFWLKFSDNSNNTAATLGKDYSGNSNNWTPNNLSVTAGAGNDSLVDTPTSYGTDTGAGGEVRGNYCTWNPLANSAGALSNGNLDLGNSGPETRCNSTISFSSGKWYYEISLNTLGTNSSAGIGQNQITNTWPGNDALSYAFELDNARTANSGSLVSYGTALAAGDIFMCAFDLDNNKIFFGKNGTWFNSSSPTTGTNPAFTLTAGSYCPIGRPYGGGSFSLNTGVRPFAYTAPTGFKALCDTNLGTPVVAKPNTVMDVKLYTGNGGTQTISGLGFSPDLIWIKSRSAAYDHQLGDTVRGVTNILHSNLTVAESTLNTITGTSSDGFTVSAASFIGTNANGQTFAAWTWDAGTSTVSNTSGSITSQVRANPSAGFSIVTWTGNGNATIGHGLGVAPQLIICKKRDGAADWQTGHASIGWTKRLALNLTTAGETTVSAWNNTAPTSTVFSVGNTSNFGGSMVSYCFAPVTGYSSFGSYTGNGSADGPFVFTGHRSRWLMVKRSDAGLNDWYVLDTARSTYNVAINELLANSSSAENPYTGVDFDLLSNGFKIRATEGSINASGGTFIYASFAESPLQYARAR